MIDYSMSDWDGILSTDDSNDSTWNVDSAYVVHVDMHRWTRYISICYFFITECACKKEWNMVRCPQKDMISDYRRSVEICAYLGGNLLPPYSEYLSDALSYLRRTNVSLDATPPVLFSHSLIRMDLTVP